MIEQRVGPALEQALAQPRAMPACRRAEGPRPSAWIKRRHAVTQTATGTARRKPRVERQGGRRDDQGEARGGCRDGLRIALALVLLVCCSSPSPSSGRCGCSSRPTISTASSRGAACRRPTRSSGSASARRFSRICVIGDPRNPDLVARGVEVQILHRLHRPACRPDHRPRRPDARPGRRRQAHASARSTGCCRRPRASRSGCPTSASTSPTLLIDLRHAGRPGGAGARRARQSRRRLPRPAGRPLARPPARRLRAFDGPVARFADQGGGPQAAVSRGPAAMQRLACGGGLGAERPLFVLRAELERRARSAGAARRCCAPPTSGRAANRLSRIQGRLGFDGNANATRGNVEIESASAASEAVRAARTRFAGRYAFSLRRGDLGLAGRGDGGERDGRRADLGLPRRRAPGRARHAGRPDRRRAGRSADPRRAGRRARRGPRCGSSAGTGAARCGWARCSSTAPAAPGLPWRAARG